MLPQQQGAYDSWTANSERSRAPADTKDPCWATVEGTSDDTGAHHQPREPPDVPMTRPESIDRTWGTFCGADKSPKG